MSVNVFPAPSTGGGGKSSITEVITSTQTWTCPTGVTKVEVILCGGGGSGVYSGYNQMAGGSGSAYYAVLSVTPGTGYTITIGAGGAGSSSADQGNDGSSSSFGSLLTASGGLKGSYYGVTPGSGRGANADFIGGKDGFQGFGSSGGGKTTSSMGSAGTAGGNGAGNGQGFVSSAVANSGAGGGSGNSGSSSGSGGSGICIIKYSA